LTPGKGKAARNKPTMTTDSPRVFNTPFRILLITLIILSFGVVMVYSASGRYSSDNRRRAVQRKYGREALLTDHQYHDSRMLAKQLTFVCIGLVAMLVAYKIDYRRLKDHGLALLIFSFILLLLVFVPVVGIKLNEHRRWINLVVFHFQPSELAKLALIIYMARMLTDHQDKISASFWHGVAPALAIVGLFDLAIIAEPDIGAAAILSVIVFMMWFIGGMRIRHLVGLIAATIPAFVYVVLMFPDRVGRVVAFMFPTPETQMGKGYQLMQSLIAVGSGGVSGLGLGNSMQKHFLNEQYSEFIFAIIGEETGLLGAGLLVLLFFLLIWEGWRVAFRAPDFYATMLAAGVTFMIGLSVAANFMVVLGLAPTKGLSLPLISYGGSSMVVTLASIGVLMNVGKYIERQKEVAASPSRKSNPARRRNRARGAWAGQSIVR
jgi:cell division protein FtsW